MCCSKGFRPDG
ncbi:hypothetical protein F383_38871 [Gossypium arboreum]|uniref:Uncharacterized protein n=1 Tax=Gossypium arboreum TaxID=29729 RepID=A0A0B0MMS1_GOSAR|nr:hypothetical protein F383_38871 [Gossypium arboreum]